MSETEILHPAFAQGETPPEIRVTASGDVINDKHDPLPHLRSTDPLKLSSDGPVSTNNHGLYVSNNNLAPDGQSDLASSAETILEPGVEQMSGISLPMPPDGGYGWVVCAGSFFCLLILDGMMFSFGVFFLDLLDYFGESKGKTAWVGSTLMGVHLIVGPFTSALINLWGVRRVAIAGSLVAGVGFISSVYVPSVSVLIFTYGIIGGIGASMIYIPALLIVGFYFEKRRALANGIANSGSGFGVFIYAPLCRYLQDMYTWRGALLILSGLLLNCLVCAALFRPVQYKHINTNTTTTDESTTTADEEKQLLSLNKRDQKILEAKVSKSQSQGDVAQNHVSNSDVMAVLDTSGARKGSMPAAVISRLRDKSNSQVSMPTSQTFHSTGQILHKSGIIYRSLGANLENRLHLSEELLQKPMYRKDAFYSGSIWKLPEYAHLDADRSHYPGSVLRLPEAMPSESDESGGPACDCSELNYFVRTLVGASLLKSPVFILCVTMSVLWTTHATVLSILPDYAVQQGVEKVKAGLLLSIIGISNIIGRLVAGWMADRPSLDVVYINAVALMGGGLTNFAIPLTSDYYLLCAEAAVFGACMATWTSLRPIVLVELLGLERLTNAFGLLAMFQGLAFCIGSPVAGCVYDYTQSYKIPFLIAGSAFVLSSLTCIPMRRLADAEKKHIIEISEIEI